MSAIPMGMKIYSSGFVGSANVPQTEPLDMVTMTRMLMTPGAIVPKGSYTANSAVVDLWNIQCSSSSQINSFEYAERVITTARKAFGCASILEWVNIQVDCGEFSDSHYTWVDETLEFVMMGKPRSRGLTAMVWTRLLSVGANSYVGEKHSNVVKSLLVGQGAGFQASAWSRDMTIDAFIRMWVTRDQGLQDLVGSLNVMFGKRDR